MHASSLRLASRLQARSAFDRAVRADVSFWAAIHDIAAEVLEMREQTRRRYPTVDSDG
jgi:hypothetical protein